MTLRLVLVGMVAALGVSIPSQPSCEHVFDSAEAWATSLLAEWDTWEPADSDLTVPAANRDHLDCEECRLAQSRVVSNALRSAAGDPTAPKFEPIEVSEPFETGLAFELNRISEGLGNTESTPPETVATTTDSESPLPADALEIELWEELYPTAMEPVEVAKPLSIERSDDEPVSCLDEEWAQAGCQGDAQAASDELSVVADLPRNVFAPAPLPARAPTFRKPAVIPAFGSLAYLAYPASPAIAPPAKTASKPFTGEIPAIGILVYLSRHQATVSSPAASGAVSAIQTTEPAEPATLVDLPRDVFAPVTAVLAQEPLQPDQSLAGTDSQPARLGDAVELTRRALSAWVSVLIGPALVDVSRR